MAYNTLEPSSRCLMVVYPLQNLVQIVLPITMTYIFFIVTILPHINDFSDFRCINRN